jgi:hypothetical protein
MKEVPSDVLASWFVTFAMLANNSLSPTQTEMATQRAGEVLHAMGIEEYKIGRTVFKALKPAGRQIDIDAEPNRHVEAVTTEEETRR